MISRWHVVVLAPFDVEFLVMMLELELLFFSRENPPTHYSVTRSSYKNNAP